jgi:hypothetical protein
MFAPQQPAPTQTLDTAQGNIPNAGISLNFIAVPTGTQVTTGHPSITGMGNSIGLRTPFGGIAQFNGNANTYFVIAPIPPGGFKPENIPQSQTSTYCGTLNTGVAFPFGNVSAPLSSSVPNARKAASTTPKRTRYRKPQ